MLLRQILRWPWPPIVLLLFGLAIAGIAAYAFNAQSAAIEQQALANLETVAQLKVESIVRSLDNGRSRAEIFSRSPVVAAFMRPAGSGPPPDLSAFFELSRVAAHLRGLALIGPDGKVLLGNVDNTAVWSAAATRAISAGETIFVDFHPRPDGGLDLGFAAPIVTHDDPAHRALGAVAVVMATETFEPQLTSWPSASNSGHAFLARREGNDILYVGQSEPGHNTIVLRQAPARTDAVTSHFASGDLAPAGGRDARGVRVLAAAAPVSGTPWLLIAKLDRREALAEVRRLGVATGLLMAAVLAAAIIFFFWLEQRRRLQATLANLAREHALQEAETQFRAVFDHAGVGIMLGSPGGRLLRANRRMCAMLGYSEPEMMKLTVAELTEPEDLPSTAAFLHGLEHGDADHFESEKRYIRRDGSTMWGSTVVQLVRKRDGSPDYAVAIVQDISERKRAEAKLRDSEDRIRQVVESAPNAMLMSDPAGVIRMVNREAEMLFGCPRSELLETSLQCLFPERLHDTFRSLYAEFLKSPHTRRIDAEQDLFSRRTDGREIPVEISITPIITDEGLMTLWTLLDLTERRRQEEALRRSEEQLWQAQKMEAIGSLTGGIAHDFNNLLSVIIINLDLAQSMLGESGGPADLIRQALGAALRGADLTRRLLAFARRQPLRPQQVALNDVVAGTIQMLGRTLGPDIQIIAQLAEKLWPVMVDPVQVESAITNLATNARDAMPSGGTITITTDNRHVDAAYAGEESGLAPGDYVMIEVSDNGTGMTPDLLAHIFEPFFTTKEVGRGTGLGLSMVFGFIKQSGGHVSVYSEPGLGTTFRLYLPRLNTPAESEAAKMAAQSVLVVEDEEPGRSEVARQMEEFGYRVQSARNATEALHLLSREPVDLVFSQLVLPGEMDGLALARQILAGCPHVKVVLTSGFREPQIDRELKAWPARLRLLTKPYRREDLAQALRDALGS